MWPKIPIPMDHSLSQTKIRQTYSRTWRSQSEILVKAFNDTFNNIRVFNFKSIAISKNIIFRQISFHGIFSLSPAFFTHRGFGFFISLFYNILYIIKMIKYTKKCKINVNIVFNKVFNKSSFQQIEFSTFSTFQHFQHFFNSPLLKTYIHKTA